MSTRETHPLIACSLFVEFSSGFDSREVAITGYNSSPYQKVRPLRIEAAEGYAVPVERQQWAARRSHRIRPRWTRQRASPTAFIRRCN